MTPNDLCSARLQVDAGLMKLLLTHTPVMRRHYYGETALGDLRALAAVTLHEADAPLSDDGLTAAAKGHDIVLSDRMTAGPAAVFDALPDLKVFMRCAVDIRTIDVAAASRAGVLVTQASPGFVASVTELAIGYLVDLARGVSQSTAAYQAGRLPEIRMGGQLAGSTLAILGYGSIGRALADVAVAMQMRVLVVDPHVSVSDARVRQVSFTTALAEADQVVCLVVATEATENLMDAAAFGRMKPGAAFINLARGNLVDEAALLDALNSGHLSGAAMDVGRATDQMPTPELARHPAVVATPHIGGLTPQAIAAQARDTVEQVRALVSGDVPAGAVNAEAWTRRLQR